MSDVKDTIPRGSKILVTGANGFIGSHVVDQLLSLGYLVRGSIREPKPWLNELFDKKYGKGKFETCIVSDLTSGAQWEGAVKGITGVVHVAADLSMNPDPNITIPHAIKATVNLLKAASQQATVKRFVLTSSSTAAYLPKPNEKGIVLTTDTWNDAAIQVAWDESIPRQGKGYIVYGASKTESERAAFKWVKENDPPFVLNTVLPAITFGKILAPEIRGSTQSLIGNILKGDAAALGFLPPQWYVDVTDAARLHIIALLSPSVNSERIFAFADTHNWTDVIKILRKLRMDNLLIPPEPENEARDLSDAVPSRRAKQLLKSYFNRSGWVSLEESIAEGISGA
ncbi:hypothetical protein N7455_002488 [Penicillium solitum]|uniref:uncharacterized protein n=1 Tax=Penicillium solitum TaxID=60172 RepID=UPI0032C45F19|nr:hypothetical protein N7455_002488 [Penicillium solitum]